MFFYFFLITFSVYVLKPGKESLFMANLGKEKLPHALLLTAILMGLAVAVNSRLLQRMSRSTYISLTLGFFILSSLVFWFFLRAQTPWRWLYLLFWSWADILLVTTITQFWIFVNDLFNPREAKRRVGFFVSGGLLGGIGGALLSRFWPADLGTKNLILVCPALLLLCMMIVLVALKRPALEAGEEATAPSGLQKERVGLFESLRMLKKHRYILLLSGMMVAAIIVSNLVDIQFKTIGKKYFPAESEMRSFFATFYIVLLVLSYFFTILLTSRILKNFGMKIALLIPPAFLLFGTLAALFIPAGALLVWLIWAIYLRGADKSLAHSLSQSVRELLYIPVPQDVKYRAKVFIDMFLNKFADGLTGLFLIIISPFLKLEIKEMSLITAVFIVFWLILNFRITREYVNIVKRNIQIKWQDADRIITEKIDVDVTKLVFDTLHSRERSSVLYAMNLFDLIKKDKLSPELQKLISFKADEIRARSMDALMDVDGEALVPEFDDSLGPESLDTQVKEIMSLDIYQELMKEKIDKVARESGREAEVSKMEAAKVIGLMDPKSPVIRELKKLLKDGSPEVVRYAAESAGKLKRREFVPLLVNNLSKPSTAEAARQALSAYGVDIIGTLKDYLGDPEVNLQVRKAIPEILARSVSERAADLLALELKKENAEVETEIIEALHKMRVNAPHIHFPEKMLLAKLVSLIRKCYLFIVQIHELRSDKKKEVLARDLENSLARTMKHVFELLGLIYPQEDIIRAYQNITVGTKKALDYSVELLDNILKRELKELLLPLIEDMSFEEKVRLSRKMIRAAEKFDFS